MARVGCVVALVACLLMLLGYIAGVHAYPRGDMDRDGKVTLTDLVELKRVLLNMDR